MRRSTVKSAFACISSKCVQTNSQYLGLRMSFKRSAGILARDISLFLIACSSSQSVYPSILISRKRSNPAMAQLGRQCPGRSVARTRPRPRHVSSSRVRKNEGQLTEDRSPKPSANTSSRGVNSVFSDLSQRFSRFAQNCTFPVVVHFSRRRGSKSAIVSPLEIDSALAEKGSTRGILFAAMLVASQSRLAQVLPVPSSPKTTACFHSLRTPDHQRINSCEIAKRDMKREPSKRSAIRWQKLLSRYLH